MGNREIRTETEMGWHDPGVDAGARNANAPRGVAGGAFCARCRVTSAALYDPPNPWKSPMLRTTAYVCRGCSSAQAAGKGFSEIQ